MDVQADHGSLTAYPAVESRWKAQYAQIPLDVGSFRRPLTRCALAQCQGMCCYDGVYLHDDEPPRLQALARQEAAFFRAIGLDLPAQVVVEAAWRGVIAGPKTAVKPASLAERVPGFPAHFANSACVFHLDDGRCGLQVLSLAHGKHPWFYKPTTCWLRPLMLSHGATPLLTLPDAATDPYHYADYPGYISVTFCGRTVACGRPAHEVLTDELAFLGMILGRSLVAELRTAIDTVDHDTRG